MTTHIVSYSGGVSSFVVADWLVKNGIRPMLLFADTLIEDEDLYRFNRDVEDRLGIPIKRIADGRTPWQVFEDERYIGNNRIDPCSRVLKRNLLKDYIASIFDHDAVVMYIGIDWTESHRLERVQKNNPWTVKAPLCDEIKMTKLEQLEYCRSAGIRLPRLYDMGFPHNNCGGFCVKTGQAQFNLLLRKMPERYAWHEAQQKKAIKVIGKKYGFIRMQGEYLTMQEFRDVKESNIDMFDFGGCGCALD